MISCDKKNQELPTGKPIARVNEKFLYKEDLPGMLSGNAKIDDSIALTKAFIEKWIQTQLVLSQAENNLSSDQSEINREVENYRNNLIIYRYESALIQQKLDTAVTEDEIEKYYNEHLSQFQLKDNIVKVAYVKVKKKIPQIEKVKRWYTSSQAKDLEALNSWCIQFAENYFLDENTWLLFEDLVKEVPVQNYNTEHFLKNTRYLEVSDSLFHYFLNIKGFKIKNSLSPLSFEHENIRNIIVNKRKLNLIDQMKRDLLEEARESKNFEIY